MKEVDEKIDSPLIQRILNPQTMMENNQPITINSTAVLEWLEEQGRESVRGQISDKPRWSE